MSDADSKLDAIERLIPLTEMRFTLELELTDAKRDFETRQAELKAAYEAKVVDIQQRINPTDAEIRDIVEANRAILIEKKKKSFVIASASFQFTERQAYLSLRAGFEETVMQIARKLGIVREVAEPPQFQWKFSLKKFKAYLKKRPALQSDFAECLELVPAQESLAIKPNEGHTVLYDGKRISPPPINIQS